MQQFGVPWSQVFRYLQLCHLLLGSSGSHSLSSKAAELLDKVLMHCGEDHEVLVYYSMMVENLGKSGLLALKGKRSESDIWGQGLG